VSAIELIAERAAAIGAAGRNDSEPVPSPCISVCRMDAVTGWCEGCFRSLDEIAAWSRMDEAGKRDIWALIVQRTQR